MALDIPKPPGYRRAWRGGINLMRTVTVCDACRQASCWQGKFFCDGARMAGTVELSLATLMQERRENEEYWFIDPATDIVDHSALESFRLNYPESCANSRRCSHGVIIPHRCRDCEQEAPPASSICEHYHQRSVCPFCSPSAASAKP